MVSASGPTGRWYFVITILTGGLLAAVPFFHAASRLERRELRQKGAVVATASAIAAALIGLAPVDAAGDPTGVLANLGGVVAVIVVIASCALLIGPRKEVYSSATPTPGPASRNDSAISAVRETRRKRSAARQLAERDASMARELGIGRPGATRSYDDGGLVDLNWADEERLTTLLGLPVPVATSLIDARGSLGRFSSVEEAIAFSAIDDASAERVRELGIVLGG